MKGTRLVSIIGGLILIAAAFLQYGLDAWASGSTFDLTMKVFNNINDQNAMLNLLEQVGQTNTLSAVLVGFVVVTFFLFLVGGILALVKNGGGSVAGPVGVVLLTAVPIIAGAAITGLGIGYWLGWVGAIICVIGTAGKSKLENMNLFVNQNQNVTVQTPTSPPSTPPPPSNK